MKTLGTKRFGIGTDIENIDRFSNLNYPKDSHFLDKIYTKKEMEYCFSRGNAAQHLAARYAGKEAITKALNSIGETNSNYKEIEIVNNVRGVPTAKINGICFSNFRIYISLSHCKDKALAFAIVMGE